MAAFLSGLANIAKTGVGDLMKLSDDPRMARIGVQMAPPFQNQGPMQPGQQPQQRRDPLDRVRSWGGLPPLNSLGQR